MYEIYYRVCTDWSIYIYVPVNTTIQFKKNFKLITKNFSFAFVT